MGTVLVRCWEEMLIHRDVLVVIEGSERHHTMGGGAIKERGTMLLMPCRYEGGHED